MDAPLILTTQINPSEIVNQRSLECGFGLEITRLKITKTLGKKSIETFRGRIH